MAKIGEMVGVTVMAALGCQSPLDEAEEAEVVPLERRQYEEAYARLASRGLLNVEWLSRQKTPSWANLAVAAGAGAKLKRGKAKAYVRQLLAGRRQPARSLGDLDAVRATPKRKRVKTETRKAAAAAPKDAWKARAPDPNSDAFLASYEWRRVRMEVLKQHGARCQCCGATPADGVRMHVDHIKPRRLFPQLALEVTNLQVLCEECNHGKGNWDMTDWRPDPTAASDLDDRLAHLLAKED